MLRFASESRFSGDVQAEGVGSQHAMVRGKVYLVGSGPGDPALLTVAAVRTLESADVVFHDDLVSSEVLELIPERVHVESVGKRCGHARLAQHQIHSLIINAARDGWKVVRLKSGDPLIFGRAGEEIEALRQAGVEYEVVPGITAAFGAAARLGIPLTDRHLASKLVFLSNHQCAGKELFDWSSALAEDTTALIYMPGPDYRGLAQRLTTGGLDPRTPCLVVSRATTSKQQAHFARLADLAEIPQHEAPVVMIVGAVADRYAPGGGKRMRDVEALMFAIDREPAELPT
jgi:uroporphyrin-III C-methyltransferase